MSLPISNILAYFKEQPYEDHLDHIFDLTRITEKKDSSEGSNNEIGVTTET